jgi:hypothetical protein
MHHPTVGAECRPGARNRPTEDAVLLPNNGVRRLGRNGSVPSAHPEDASSRRQRRREADRRRHRPLRTRHNSLRRQSKRTPGRIPVETETLQISGQGPAQIDDKERVPIDASKTSVVDARKTPHSNSLELATAEENRAPISEARRVLDGVRRSHRLTNAIGETEVPLRVRSPRDSDQRPDRRRRSL